MTRLTDVVRQALKATPNLSALGKEAGVSQTLLAKIRRGQRQATPRVAAKVAVTLLVWSKRFRRVGSRVRQVAQKKASKRRGSR